MPTIVTTRILSNLTILHYYASDEKGKGESLVSSLKLLNQLHNSFEPLFHCMGPSTLKALHKHVLCFTCDISNKIPCVFLDDWLS